MFDFIKRHKGKMLSWAFAFAAVSTASIFSFGAVLAVASYAVAAGWVSSVAAGMVMSLAVFATGFAVLGGCAGMLQGLVFDLYGTSHTHKHRHSESHAHVLRTFARRKPAGDHAAAATPHPAQDASAPAATASSSRAAKAATPPARRRDHSPVSPVNDVFGEYRGSSHHSNGRPRSASHGAP